MPSGNIIQDMKVVQLMPASADIFDGSARSNTINMQDYTHCTAVLNKGAMSATGTARLTVNSSATSAGTSLTTIPFRVKVSTTGSQDLYDDEANQAGTGYLIEANTDNTCDIIEVNASDMDGTDKYLTFIYTEVTNDTILAGLVGILSGARQQGDDKRTVRV